MSMKGLVVARTATAFIIASLALACGSQSRDRSDAYWNARARADGPAAWQPNNPEQRPPWQEPNAPPPDYGYGYPASLDMVGADFHGDIGLVSVDHDANLVDGWDDGYYATITAIVERANNGAAMAILDISGGIDRLEPGTTNTYSLNQYNEDLHVTFVGCSGETAPMWDYDMPADEVEITPSMDPDAPNILHIDYRATFVSANPNVVTGRMTIAQP